MKTLQRSPLPLLLAAAALVGCGGSGGGSTAGAGPVTTLAVVKVGTSGTLPAGATIGGILAHVVAAPSAGLTLADADVAPTGAAAGALLVPNIQTDVILGVLSATGIQAGEFATLTYHLGAGATPKAGDFSIAPGATVLDAATGASLPGVQVLVQSVSLQP